MLKINFNPVNANHIEGIKPLELTWNDPVLTVVSGMDQNNNIIENVDFDLSLIEDGSTIEHDLLMKVERIGDDYELTIILPIGSNPPYESCFPVPIEVTENGVVPVPLFDTPVVEEEQVFEEIIINLPDEEVIQ